MRTETTGTVVGGTLQLDECLDLPDHSRVRVAVEPVDKWPARFQTGLNAWKEARRHSPVNGGGRRYTREELHERH
jgi:hypothetical protein